jgi:hypothetical protein
MSATSIFDRIASHLKDDPEKSEYISEAQGQTSSDYYGTNYDRAVALRAAHNMTIDKPAESGVNSSGGQIVGKREGDLSLTFSQSGIEPGSNEDLSRTSYGVTLLGLRKGTCPSVSVTGGNLSGI